MLRSGGAAVKQLLVLPGKPDEVTQCAVVLTHSLIAAGAVGWYSRSISVGLLKYFKNCSSPLKKNKKQKNCKPQSV